MIASSVVCPSAGDSPPLVGTADQLAHDGSSSFNSVLSKSQRRRVSRLKAKTIAKDPVSQEVLARMSAIEPSIIAGVHATNLTGSARAKRNVATHNFALAKPFHQYADNEFQQLQRSALLGDRLQTRLDALLIGSRLPSSCLCSFISEFGDTIDKSYNLVGMLEFFKGDEEDVKATLCDDFKQATRVLSDTEVACMKAVLHMHVHGIHAQSCAEVANCIFGHLEAAARCLDFERIVESLACEEKVIEELQSHEAICALRCAAMHPEARDIAKGRFAEEFMKTGNEMWLSDSDDSLVDTDRIDTSLWI